MTWFSKSYNWMSGEQALNIARKSGVRTVGEGAVVGGALPLTGAAIDYGFYDGRKGDQWLTAAAITTPIGAGMGAWAKAGANSVVRGFIPVHKSVMDNRIADKSVRFIDKLSDLAKLYKKGDLPDWYADTMKKKRAHDYIMADTGGSFTKLWSGWNNIYE